MDPTSYDSMLRDFDGGGITLPELPKKRLVTQFNGGGRLSRTYDRTRDVPKLKGCNTRNFPYRWDIFERHLSSIPDGAEALDFGAGSLRETFEMAERGFKVTSVDLNPSSLEDYARDYDWSHVRFRPTFTDRIPATGRFHLITAFDVIEHLRNPAADALDQFRAVLAPGGLIFGTVPNLWSFSEIATLIALRAGRRLPPGEAHLQFRSPRAWRALFAESGLEVVDHDMTIGCAVNTWYWSVFLPVNALRKLARKVRLDVDPERVVNALASDRVMRHLDRLDQLAKPITHRFFTWNLFVLRAAPS